MVMHVEIIESKILKPRVHNPGHRCFVGPFVKRLRQCCQPIVTKNWCHATMPRERPHHKMPKSYNTPRPRGLLPEATQYKAETTQYNPEAAKYNPEAARTNPISTLAARGCPMQPRSCPSQPRGCRRHLWGRPLQPPGHPRHPKAAQYNPEAAQYNSWPAKCKPCCPLPL